MAAPVAFVGRENELSRLLAALGGDAGLVLVVGDAGVGKTRFADEGMARAAAAGMVLVRGECLPLTEALPRGQRRLRSRIGAAGRGTGAVGGRPR